MEKCGRQKVTITFFLRSETQTKIFGRQIKLITNTPTTQKP